MPAYLIIHVTLTDPERYREYTRHSPRVVAQYGGRFIVRGAAEATLEGPPDTGRIVVIEFPDVASVHRFYDSPEYTAIRRIRDGAGHAQFIVVDGYPESAWLEALATSRAAG